MHTAVPDPEQSRLRGWQFALFNAVMGLAHMLVLFNAGSYVALLPHAAGDLGGVLPSFGTWAQTDFMIALALAFPIGRWLSGRYGESPGLRGRLPRVCSGLGSLRHRPYY
jgi:DHA2 family multidrug resistance protein